MYCVVAILSISVGTEVFFEVDIDAVLAKPSDDTKIKKYIQKEKVMNFKYLVI